MKLSTVIPVFNEMESLQQLYAELSEVAHKAAIELEKLWNAEQEKHAFVLLCAYALGNFYKTSHGDALGRVCSTHTHVLPSERYLELDELGRMREVAALQQRSRSLETEIEPAGGDERRDAHVRGVLRRVPVDRLVDLLEEILVVAIRTSAPPYRL